MTNLDELEALARAATQGEWEVRENTGLDEFWGDWHNVGPISFTGGKLRKDTAYVAAANPATVLSLIAEVRRLREALERLGSPLAFVTSKATNVEERARMFYADAVLSGDIEGPEAYAVQRALGDTNVERT